MFVHLSQPVAAVALQRSLEVGHRLGRRAGDVDKPGGAVIGHHVRHRSRDDGKPCGEELRSLGGADVPRRVVYRERHQNGVPAAHVKGQILVLTKSEPVDVRFARQIGLGDLHDRPDHHERPVWLEPSDVADEPGSNRSSMTA